MADLLGQLLDLLASDVTILQGRPAHNTSSFGVGFGAILEAILISECDADPIFSSIPLDVAEAVLRVEEDGKAEEAIGKTPWLNAGARPFYPLNVNAPEFVPLMPETGVSLAKLGASLGVPTSELSKATGGWWGNSTSGIRVSQWLASDKAPLADHVEHFSGAAASNEGITEPVGLISASSLASDLGYLTHQYESHSSNWSGTLSSSDRSVSPSGLMDMDIIAAKGQLGQFSPPGGFSIMEPPFELTTPPVPTHSPPPNQISQMASFPAPLQFTPPNDAGMIEILAAGVHAGNETVANDFRRGLGLDESYSAHLLSSDLAMAISGMAEEVGDRECGDGTTGQLPFPSMEDALFEYQNQVAGNSEFYEEELLFRNETAMKGGAPAQPKLKLPLVECLAGNPPQEFHPARKTGKMSSFVQEFHAALAQKEETAHTATPKRDIKIIAATGNQVDPVSDCQTIGVHTEQPPPKANDCLILERAPDETGPAFTDPPPAELPKNHDSRKMNLMEVVDLQAKVSTDDIEKEEPEVLVAEKENFEIIDDSEKSRKESRKEQFLRLFKEAFQF